jgi:tetratricopeptide (TPR) repeat protein
MIAIISLFLIFIQQTEVQSVIKEACIAELESPFSFENNPNKSEDSAGISEKFCGQELFESIDRQWRLIDDLQQYNCMSAEGSVNTTQLNVRILNHIASSCNQEGEYEKAIEVSDRALTLIEDSDFLISPVPWTYYDYLLNTKAVALINLGMYEEANEVLDVILRNEDAPSFVRYWTTLNNKGFVLSHLGRYEEAIEYYERALATLSKYRPNDPLILNNIGAALADSGRYEEAIEYYDKVLTIDPNDSVALNNKGAALTELGMYEEAGKYYDKLLSSKEVLLDIFLYEQSLKNNYEPLYDQNKASVYFVEYGKNREYSNTDLGMKPNKIILEHAAFMNNLGRLGESNNLHYIALGAISRTGGSGSVDINIVMKVAKVNEGIRLFQSEKIEEAKQIFDNVLESDQNNVACNYYIGQYLLKVNKTADAQKQLSKAQSLAKSSNEVYNGESVTIKQYIS